MSRTEGAEHQATDSATAKLALEKAVRDLPATTENSSHSGNPQQPPTINNGQGPTHVPPPMDQAHLHYDATENPHQEEAEVDDLLGTAQPTDNYQPTNPLRYGGPVPSFSPETHIPFLTETNKLQNAYIHCLPDDVPEELRDLDSPRWKDGKFLIQTFLVLNPRTGRRTKAKIQLPLCLMLSAKTLMDRLTVVNFWLSQPKDDQIKMIRNREEGLLKYYMQLKDTRENTFRQAYISGNPLQQLKKKRDKQLTSIPPPEPPKDVEETRTVVVDEHSSCLDYILRPSLLCVPCDQFRNRFLPPHHRGDFDRWGLYKDRRKEIVQDAAINPNGEYTCQQLFDTTKEVGRGAGHRKKRVLDFIEEKRVVQKTPSLVEWERKRTSKPCFGLSGEGFRQLILQAAEQANRTAILKDEIIPDTFGLPHCYHNRTGFENVVVRKEERLLKVYSRNRAGKASNGSKTSSSSSSSAKSDNEEEMASLPDDPTPASADGGGEKPQGQDPSTPAEEDAAKAAGDAGVKNNSDAANQQDESRSKYHYVIRSKDCAGDVDTEKGHKLCKACTEAAVMVRSVARDAAKPLNLSKGAALTKLDVAKLVTSPDLIESTFRNLRQLRTKEVKIAQKELVRLRDKVGLPAKQTFVEKRRATNEAVLEQLHHVEQQMQASPRMQTMDVTGYRRYELGDHEANPHHEVYYDSDDPAGNDEGMIPRGSTTVVPSPNKRQRINYPELVHNEHR